MRLTLPAALAATTPAALAAATVLLAGPAAAVTLTFDDVPETGPQLPQVIVESGVTITAPEASTGIGYDQTPGRIHLDDSGTSNPWLLDFTAPARFDAVSFDVIGLGQSALEAGSEEPVQVAYDNIQVQGWRDGAVVTETFFSTGLDRGPQSFALDAGFAGLSLLRIIAILPPIGAGLECADFPCGHFDLDAVTLDLAPAPVPLPAALPLGLTGLAMLGLLARRRRGSGGR